MSGNEIASSGIESQANHVTCDSCSGACCRRDIIMPLSKKEALYLRAAGTILDKIDNPLDFNAAPPRLGKKYYQLGTDCGNLDQETNMCTDYENRPKVCRSFEEGTPDCDIMLKVYEAKVDLGMPSFPPAS